MTETAIPQKKASAVRNVVIALLVIVAFFASYRFAVALNSGNSASATGAVSATQASGGSGATATGAGDASGSGSPACACCGGGSGSSTPVEGAATLEGSVQRIDVDTSSGSYSPNVIKLKAGVPAELTFPQSGGCLGQVMSKDLNFFEDLTSGPKTVKLAALEPGTYGFSCGMQMVFGSIVVE